MAPSRSLLNACKTLLSSLVSAYPAQAQLGDFCEMACIAKHHSVSQAHADLRALLLVGGKIASRDGRPASEIQPAGLEWLAKKAAQPPPCTVVPPHCTAPNAHTICGPARALPAPAGPQNVGGARAQGRPGAAMHAMRVRTTRTHICRRDACRARG